MLGWSYHDSDCEFRFQWRCQGRRTDVIQHGNFASLLKPHPADPPSDCRELWLIPGDFHTRLTFLPACCLISGSASSVDRRGAFMNKNPKFPIIFRHNWIQMMLNERRQSCFLSLSSSLHCGDLHSMMSLFPIIPLEASPAKRMILANFQTMPIQSQ